MAAVAASQIFLAAPGRAAEPSHLVYAREKSAGSCPDEAGLRAAVAERIGYDPFFPWAKQTVVAEVFEEAGALRARLALIGDDGFVRGSQEFTGSDCPELMASLALAISIALDPMPPKARPTPDPTMPEAEPEEASAETPAPPKTTSPDPNTPITNNRASKVSEDLASTHAERPPLAESPWRVRAGPFLLFGVEPNAAVGGRVGVSLALPPWRIAAAVQGDFGGSAQSPQGGEVHAQLFAGSLAPCFVSGPLAGCGVVLAGALWTHGALIDRSRSESVFHASAGLRVEALLLAWAAGEVLLVGDALRTLTPVDLYLHGSIVWSTSPIAGALSAEASFRFP